MSKPFLIREYRCEDETAWLKAWAHVVITSHAWYFVYQVRPKYDRSAIRLVAESDGLIVGFLDIELEDEPGEICFRRDALGGFAWEFGVLPEYRGQGIGRALVEEGARRVRQAGRSHVEYWSMDENAWGFYRHMGMVELERHYQFFFRPSGRLSDVRGLASQLGVNVQFLYGTCDVARWEEVCRELEVLNDKYVDAHLCIGFDHLCCRIS